MPSPVEVSDAIMDGLNEHYGYLESEVLTESNGKLSVALYCTDGDCYELLIEPDDANASERRKARKRNSRAYREGWISFYIEKGLPEDNPYIEGSEARTFWSAGYTDAHKEFTGECL